MWSAISLYSPTRTVIGLFRGELRCEDSGEQGRLRHPEATAGIKTGAAVCFQKTHLADMSGLGLRPVAVTQPIIMEVNKMINLQDSISPSTLCKTELKILHFYLAKAEALWYVLNSPQVRHKCLGDIY